MKKLNILILHVFTLSVPNIYSPFFKYQLECSNFENLENLDINFIKELDLNYWLSYCFGMKWFEFLQ